MSIMRPEEGNLLLRSGAPVAKYEDHMFRAWSPQGWDALPDPADNLKNEIQCKTNILLT